MYRVSTKDRERFIAAIVEEVAKARPHYTSEHGLDIQRGVAENATTLARRILRWGRTYGRLAEEECNGDWPLRRADQAAWAKELERQQERAETQLTIACAQLCDLVCATDCATRHFWPHFSGDPRGHTVKLRVPSGRSDHPEGGLCVPTS